MSPTEPPWTFVLYTAGNTPRSRQAFANITKYGEQYLDNHYSIEVVDLLVQPQRAEGDQILALPTLVRRSPQPPCRVIGDLADEKKVLASLHIPAAMN